MMRPSLRCTLRRQSELQNWHALSTTLSACNAADWRVKSKLAIPVCVAGGLATVPACAFRSRKEMAGRAVEVVTAVLKKLRRENRWLDIIGLSLCSHAQSCIRDRRHTRKFERHFRSSTPLI